MLCVAIAAGCGEAAPDSTSTSLPGEEVRLRLTVGDLIPLTGRLSDFGRPGKKAADLAVERIQRAIHEVGANHRVTLRHADGQSEPEAAVQAARTLAADGATCLAGPWTAETTVAVAESVTIGEGVLLISPASTSDGLSDLDDDGLVNRTVTPDSRQGPVLVEVIDRELGGVRGKVVNVGARDDAYGNGLLESFTSAWKAAGGEVGQALVYDPNLPQYGSVAARLVEGDPDAYLIFDFPQTFGQLGPALARTGQFDPERAFTSDGLAVTDLPALAGDEATEGLRGTAPASSYNRGAAAAFDELFAHGGGPERQTFDAQNFDAVILCYLAAVAAASTNGADMAAQVRTISAPGGARFSWRELPKAIEALQNGEDIDYEGASGPIDMDDAGDATAGAYDLFTFEDGEIEVFGQVPIPRGRLEE